MSELLRSKLFWNDVSLSGLIVGGVLAGAAGSAYFLRDSTIVTVVNNIILLLAFIIIPYLLGKRFAKRNALWGITFLRALKYMVIMYALAGFIYGFSLFLILQCDMEYYMTLYAEFIKSMNVNGAEITDNMVEEVLASPFQLAMSSMFSLSFIALLPSLIISALIKREPAIKDYK